MRICGVELTANDAVVCLLHLERGQFHVLECRVRKIQLKKGHTRQDLQEFQFAFAKLMADYSVDKVAIKERMPKGKFAGGAIGFKLEATIQLIAELDVEVIPPTRIKAALSKNPIPIPFSKTGLKVFQETAFTVAYAAHMLD